MAICRGCGLNQHPESCIDALRAENARLRVALEFYANEENYNSEGAPTYDQKGSTPASDNGGFGIEYDQGKCARKALEPK